IERYVAAGLAEELVVDVREQTDLAFLGDLREHRIGLPEGGPALDRIREEARSRRLERPSQLLRDLDRGAAQHLGVELIRPGLNLALDLVEQGDQLVAFDREPVALRL